MAAKRSIFEEVGREPGSDVARRAEAAPSAARIDRERPGARKAVRLWLVLLFVLVVLMIAVGGITRLTDSGLSITEWRPVSGALPPIGTGAWQAEFDRYQQSPEYLNQNRGMTLEEFRRIFWWEWAHRQLGRVIGLVWAVGFAALWLTGRVPVGWAGRLWLLGGLGALQGAIGWWMVASGLVGERVDVASYRLAVHLGIAFVILGLIAWFVLRLGRTATDLLQARRARERKLWGMATGLMHLAMVQILLGALVAGIDAGRGYTDWPLMAGGLLPPGMFEITPWWRNFFENDGLVQFLHRMAGYLLFAFGLAVWWRARRSPVATTRGAFAVMAGMLVLQVLLGIVTVVYSAPLVLALLHQLGAVALWVLILRARFNAGYPQPQTVRGRR